MTEQPPGPGMSPEERAAYRAFLREHHPDRGGDPDAFIAGLARFRAITPHDDPDSARWDAPVEIVHPLPLPTRVVVALIRTIRRQRSRRVE